MSQLNSLLESAGSGWKNMQSDAARLANKWEKTGLLEGFNKEVDKNNGKEENKSIKDDKSENEITPKKKPKKKRVLKKNK